MKIVYIDTSILLAKWIGTDPFHNESKILLGAIEIGKIKGYFSTFGLCEVVSVVKRQEQKFSLKLHTKQSVPILYLKKIRKIPNLQFFNDSNNLKVSIAGKPTEILASYWLTINNGSKTGLKTLDNVHLAISKVISTITGENVDYFVTGDGGILKKTKEIKKLTGISVVTPELVIQLEGLE